MFEDRVDAGTRLAQKVIDAGVTASIVLGLPRGGVPVAAEVASRMGLPLDVLVVRKLGLPGHPEVAMGAIGEDGVRLVDAELVRRLGITAAQIDAVERRERATLDARVASLRHGRPRLDLSGRTVLIVDDGIATGATASAACMVARRLGAAHVVVAAPVGGLDAVARVDGADRVICVMQPWNFRAVGEHYRRFDQTTDDEVASLLTAQARP